MGLVLINSTGPPIKRRAGLRIKQAGRGQRRGMALRQLLKSLCNNSFWSYALLWKLRNGNPGILTWGDGYFNYPKRRELDEIVSNDAHCEGAGNMLCPEFQTDIGGHSEDHSVELLVEGMSDLQYSLGQGAVGKVASKRNHCWISFTDIFNGEVKCPQEWLPQFVSGVKTIVLVPVLPHGVLQLGSFEEVCEDVNIIAYVKSRFDYLPNVQESGTTIFLEQDFEVNPSAATNNVHIDNDNLSTGSRDMPLLTVEDASTPAGKILYGAFGFEGKNATDVSSESMTAGELEIVESKLFELSRLVEELQAYSDCNGYSMGLSGEPFSEIMNSYPIGDMAGETSCRKMDTDMDNKNIQSFLRFPDDSELHKALGPAFRNQPNEKLQDLSFFVGNTCNFPGLSPNIDSRERTEMSWLARGTDAGYLLEAVVADACGKGDTCDISHNLKLCNSLPGHFTVFHKPQKESKSPTSPQHVSTPRCHPASASVNETRTADGASDTSKSMTSRFLTKVQQEDCSDAQLRKGHRTSNANRRTKSSDNKKPRPRDRQLIQDRVKELRGLVPNGAKCSIDSLLDQTVKHMLYSRSVKNQAEKLRQCECKELDRLKSWRALETNDICENGTSRAFQLSNECQVCPIFVEDLASPGYLLIEMLSDDQGFFLEIAEVIHGLDLTILKGVQESRSNQTWARFIVEASKGFHRLDIFWPLMQLLQRKRNPISSKI